MKYALNVDKLTGRIMSVTYDRFAPAYQPRVDDFPKPSCDYLYVDGEFIYDPLPQPEVDPENEISTEQRVADLEAAVLELAEMLGGEG